MSTFSLDLIEKDFVYYWLMSRNSSFVPSVFIDVSNGFRSKFESETLKINLDFLVCPQLVLNNIVLGQVFGDPYYFALPEILTQSVHPTSRRFVFDTERQEFLEFHWYTQQDLLLIIWLKFMADSRLMSYFVLYDMAGNTSRRPQRVIQSKEIILQKESAVNQLIPTQETYSSNQCVSLSDGIEKRLEAVPQAREFVRNLLGSFEGVIRTSEFELDSFKLLKSSIEACKVSLSCREPSEDVKRRERRRWCMPSLLFPELPMVRDPEPLAVVHHFMQCTLSDTQKLKKLLDSFAVVSPKVNYTGHELLRQEGSTPASSHSEKYKGTYAAANSHFYSLPRNPSMRMQQRYTATRGYQLDTVEEQSFHNSPSSLEKNHDNHSDYCLNDAMSSSDSDFLFPPSFD